MTVAVTGNLQEAMLNDQDDDYWHYNMGIMKARTMPFDVELLNGWFRFNPVVFFVSIIGIVTFVSYCNDDPDRALENIDKWRDWIGDNCIWLYIGSVGAFFIFDAYLMCSRFGSVVLGTPGEPPRFSTASWFAMLFSAGIGIGLFYYGVSEPIYHYTGSNRWAKLPRFERAIAAMNVSWFHWGLAPSACYSVVGLPIAYYAHRENMPCSMRTVFYPLMGKAIHGIIGDIIDIFAVMGTMFGIGTSLGLGCDTIASGLNRIFEDDFKNNLDNQKIIIWVITAFATVSVATGLDYGIRRLSEGNFLLGLFVLGVLAMAGDSFYLMNLFVETAGHHIWSIVDLEFHTDAFHQNADIMQGEDNKGGFMTGWTVFYWGWWISWAPFVGVFIAQISKGRTVREFVLGNVFVPSLLTSLWFTIYGGLGLQMEMNAEAKGLGGNYHALMPETKAAIGTTRFLTSNGTDTKTYQGFDPAYPDSLTQSLNVSANTWSTKGSFPKDQTFTENAGTFDGVTGANTFTRITYDPARYDYAFNKPICDGTHIDPDNSKLKRLSCRSHSDRLWDVIDANSYGMEKFISFVTVIAVITYFVTSSDSGSMVVDMLCSNGLQEPPILQRIFWGIAEGAVAFSLLQAGGDNAILALQTASIAAGLPFCIIMIGMMIATYQMFIDMELADPDFLKTQQAQIDAANQQRREKFGTPRRWKRRLLEYVNKTIVGVVTMGRPNIIDFAKALFVPCMVDYETLVSAGLNPMFGTITAGVFFFGFILFHFLELAERGLWTFAWMCYFVFCGVTALNRSQIRSKFNIRGDGMCDFCIICFCYSCAVLQANEEVEELMTELQDQKSP
jgi:Cys-rich protein (TIGR01571 family)